MPSSGDVCAGGDAEYGAGPVRVLVLRGGAIGDFICTLPVLLALRGHWPRTHIELIAYPRTGALALAAGLVDRVVSLDDGQTARLFAHPPALSEDQRAHVRSFHVVLSLLHDPDHRVRENLLTAGAGRVITGTPILSDTHAVPHLMKPLEALGIRYRGDPPLLDLPPRDLVFGARWLGGRGLRRPVAIHPGSGSAAKNWPLARYQGIAQRLTTSGRGQPFFILGEAEADIAPALRDAEVHHPILEGRELLDVASAIAQAAAFVGNDSGISHLASSLGRPVVALFGPSNPAHWAPRGPRVRILQAPDGDLARLDTDTVWSALCKCLQSEQRGAA